MTPTHLLRAVFLAIAFALTGAAHASAAKDVRYKDEIFKQVKVQRDVQYGVGPATATTAEQPLLMDVYRPKGDTVKRRPAVIWVHGGGFAAGDKSSKEIVDLAKTFARKGYATFSINYRLLVSTGCGGTGDAISPECYEAALGAGHDAQAAVRYLRANTKRLQIDPKRIGMGGTSAGAIVSSGVAALSAQPGESGNPGFSSAIESFVSISGGLPGGVFVDAETAPGILFASTLDPVVPYKWSPEMADKMASFGIPAKLVTFESDVHVPYEQYRPTILGETTKSLYRNLDLKRAQGAKNG